MTLIEVSNKALEKEFILLPVKLYKEVDEWIRPLDKDIKNVFDPKNNKLFKRGGKSIRWVLQDDRKKIIGRVAAFVNPRIVNKDNDQPTGGMGFFECINDKDAAFTLFEACQKWLTENGMEAMDGPINFGERDSWWGLLVKGFDKEPNYRCNYNFKYYRDLFEAYGFKEYFQQYTFARKILDPLSPKVAEKAERVARNPNYSFRHLRMKDFEKYIEDFRTIYNNAWASHKGVAQMPKLQARKIFYEMKPLIDEKIVWFGYYKDEPIAFYIMLPEVNQIFKYVNGRMDLIGKLKFLYHKKRKTCKKILAMVFGVVPEHQRKGVEGAIIRDGAKMIQEDYYRYEDLEMNWVGDFNPHMIRVVEEQVGAYRSKIHITYRKLFDESKPFKRHPIKN